MNGHGFVPILDDEQGQRLDELLGDAEHRAEDDHHLHPERGLFADRLLEDA